MHFERGGLVDGHHHGFADEAASEEMPHDVLRHRLQAVVAREDVVLPAQLPFELRFLFRVELRGLYEGVNVLIQVRVHELQFRRAILVKERHRRAVLDGLLEVVDGHVIAEHVLGALLSGQEGCAGKGHEDRPG